MKNLVNSENICSTAGAEVQCNSNIEEVLRALTKYVQYLVEDKQDDYLKLIDEVKKNRLRSECNLIPSISHQYLSLDEVCAEFALPRNNIKDRRWRKNNNFPLGNSSSGCRLRFRREDIEQWDANRRKAG